jgi:hypothetical protein
VLARIRVKWFRFTRAEDIFDAWPGDEPMTSEEPVARTSSRRSSPQLAG